MMFVGLILFAVACAAAFLLTALNGNVQYNILPADVFAGKAPKDRAFRLGGMVEQGSVRREPGSMQIQFDITDFAKEVTVRYSGVLPDLFREGQGVVVRGKLVENAPGLQVGQQLMIAEEVLAKHDENYMPPHVAEGLKQSHEARRMTETAAPPVAYN
jgi:cytochrome c-type biogenesis protein CcmE